MYVDDQLVGTIGPDGQSAVDLEPGKHRLHLQHRDVWLYDDEASYSVDEGETWVEVSARPFSTRFELVDDPPWSPRSRSPVGTDPP